MKEETGTSHNSEKHEESTAAIGTPCGEAEPVNYHNTNTTQEQTNTPINERVEISRADHWHLRLACIEILIVAITGYFFFGEYWEIRNQSILMESQIDSDAAEGKTSDANTSTQIGLLRKQIKVSQDNLDLLKQQLRLDQRPWIGVVAVNTEGGKQDHQSFSVGKVVMMISNTGRTPALKVRKNSLITSRIWTDPIPQYEQEIANVRTANRVMSNRILEQATRIYPKMKEQFRKRSMEFDAMRESMIKHVSEQYEGGSIPPASLPQIVPLVSGSTWNRRTEKDQPMTIYIIGKITYFDIFPGNTLHTTRFCFMYRGDAGTQFLNCPGQADMN